MKQFFLIFSLWLIFSLVLSACGPSPEEIATMTAASWTATPLPTATPTPVLYNLSLTVVDPDGLPIEGALVSISEQSQISDAQGVVTFSGLTEASVSISLSAPGYLPTEISASLQPGENQLSQALSFDPFGLLPKFACAPGETLLYLEDFQDGQATDWEVIEMKLPNWSLEPEPGEEENLVMAARQGASWAQLGDETRYAFDNSVWRLHFLYLGGGSSHLNWRFNPQEGDRRYIIGVSPGNTHLRRFDAGNDVNIGNAGSPGAGWHLLEISFFNGTVAVYLDGQEGITWTDPNPLAPGTISLEPYPEGEAVFYYDNISVCALSAPFTPIPRAETGIHLSLTLTDADGNPIPQASASIAELGSLADATLISDAQGQLAWTNLPRVRATLSINAPGYVPFEEKLELQRGENQQSITLERDPLRPTLAQVCRPEETLVYLEDYQDGLAQGWRGFENGASGLSLANAPDAEGNIVAAMQYNVNSQVVSDRLDSGQTFIDAVWRFLFMPTVKFSSDSWASFNWLHNLQPYDLNGTQVGDSRYQIPFGAISLDLRRIQEPVSNLGAATGRSTPKPGVWNLIEISTFQGLTQVWLNGVKVLQFQDTNPLPPGTIGMEAWLRHETDPILFFDNMAVCALSAPFVSLTTGE